MEPAQPPAATDAYRPPAAGLLPVQVHGPQARHRIAALWLASTGIWGLMNTHLPLPYVPGLGNPGASILFYAPVQEISIWICYLTAAMLAARGRHIALYAASALIAHQLYMDWQYGFFFLDPLWYLIGAAALWLLRPTAARRT